MIQNDDRLTKKNEKEKREYNKIKEKLFSMSLGKNQNDFKRYLNIKRQKTNYGTLTNRVYDLIKFLQWFPNKRIIDIDEDEVLDFFCDLDEDSIKYVSTKKRKKDDDSKIELSVYTYETKITIKKSLKTYFRTLLGEYNYIKRYSNLKGLKTYYNPTERPYITLDNCKAIQRGILENERNIERKLRDLFVISFLFEMGCRCCELKAMKLKDIYFDNNSNKWIAFIPKVKTIERTIAIEMFETYITKYIEYLIKEKELSLETKIVDLADKTIREIVNKNSIKYLGKEFDYVTTHTLRHSSAFFFTKEKTNLNYQDFTKRFGWSIKSKEATRYFDKSRIITSEVVESVSKSEVMKYESKYNEQEDKISKLENESKENNNKFNELDLKFNSLFGELKQREKKELDSNVKINFKYGENQILGSRSLGKILKDRKFLEILEKNNLLEDLDKIQDFYDNYVKVWEEDGKLKIKVLGGDMAELFNGLNKEMVRKVYKDDYEAFEKFFLQTIILEKINEYKAEQKVKEIMNN